MEKIEIRNIKGVHFAFFNGVKLPFLVKSVISQDYDGVTRADLTFEVELENKDELNFIIPRSGVLRAEISAKKRNGST